MNRKLKKELRAAFFASGPARKTEFLNSLPYPKATALEFYISQVGYIRKRFWSLSLFVMAALILTAYKFQSGYESVGLLSSMLPLFTLIGVIEISKSTSFGMEELEMSCKYNLGKITLLRLSVISSFQFIMLLVSLLFFSNHTQYGFLRYALYSVMPFLVCSYVSFWMMNHLKTKDCLYVSSGAAGFSGICVFLVTKNAAFLYNSKYIAYWSIALIMIIILLVKEMKHLIKQTEELRWNFV